MTELLDCFSDLTPRDRELILQLAMDVPFAAGDILVEHGARTRELMIVMEGEVRVTIGHKRASGGRDVAVLGPGSLLGEISFITAEPASATVIGRGSGRVLRVAHALLDNLVDEDGAFGSRLYLSLCRILAQRLRSSIPQDPAVSQR
jgi:CRP-like cAMP-binding protein